MHRDFSESEKAKLLGYVRMIKIRTIIVFLVNL